MGSEKGWIHHKSYFPHSQRIFNVNLCAMCVILSSIDDGLSQSKAIKKNSSFIVAVFGYAPLLQLEALAFPPLRVLLNAN